MNNSYSGAYAGALLSLAVEEGQVAEYLQVMNDLSSLFAKEPSLLEFLSSYSLPRETIYKTISKSFASVRLKSLIPFFEVLVQRHRISGFRGIAKSFAVLADDYLGIKEGILYSAKPLNENEISAIAFAVEKRLGSHVRLSARVEPSLLGGVKVAIDGKVYDGSLENRIENLRRQLLEGGASK
jgi:F-type H+-transporting ATPase subunit delta